MKLQWYFGIQQLRLFSVSQQEEPINKSVHIEWTLFVDGASRNNPGDAGAGIFILKQSVPFLQEGFYLGKKTNNQAEYLSLLLGIFLVRQHMHDKDALTIFSDSQLVVRQMLGEYKMRHDVLRPLFLLSQKLLTSITCRIHHILRDNNQQADLMANKGIELRTVPPEDFITLLQQHEIIL